MPAANQYQSVLAKILHIECRVGRVYDDNDFVRVAAINAQARAWLRDVESCIATTSVALVRVVVVIAPFLSDAGTPACPKWQRVSHSKITGYCIICDRSSTPGTRIDLGPRCPYANVVKLGCPPRCDWRRWVQDVVLSRVLFRSVHHVTGALSEPCLVRCSSLDLAMLWHLLTIPLPRLKGSRDAPQLLRVIVRERHSRIQLSDSTMAVREIVRTLLRSSQIVKHRLHASTRELWMRCSRQHLQNITFAGLYRPSLRVEHYC